MTYERGKTYPPAPIQRLMQHGTLKDPLWFGFASRGGSDATALAELAKDKITGWAPMETITVRHRGKTWKRQRPMIGGYIFAQFTGRPMWDLLMQRVGIPIGNGGTPRPITNAEMMNMEQMPETLRAEAEAKTEEARLRFLAAEAKAEALRIHPHDRVELEDGLFKGQCVEVDSVFQGVANFYMQGIRMSVEVARLKKIT